MTGPKGSSDFCFLIDKDISLGHTLSYGSHRLDKQSLYVVPARLQESQENKITKQCELNVPSVLL